ncbi:hypothetical protein W02_31070 [Nitrospira sp. KM1]|uniref:cytochrome ubiquinol oxidase subunit I n=1 Tax=Nitrospira sp. KM1 TaxID=1936990 RepID=UPI0013A79429|nr:cytochrome ubiquinol oxidase subunit I [Nitrospira sp. KM1]BCA55967.1 hypothetical protein W02_31070 [Nitrospira sp. KM1]
MIEQEPLFIPMLAGRVAIATAALTHSLFATFIVGTSLIAAAVATVWFLSRAPEHQRLARALAFTLVLATGTVSFFGVIFVFSLNIFWPRFWHRIFHIMMWPFLAEVMLFLGEAILAYAWYYLWDWSSRHAVYRRWHLGFIWGAALCAVSAMFMIDITASYMLTPFPAESGWQNVLNPTMIHLDLHRWFGNLTWAGFALAGINAVGLVRAKDSSERAYFQWAADRFFVIGFGALLVMPIIGYQYLLHLRYGQPQAFQVLMLGERSWLFDLVALLYGLLVFLGSLHVVHMVRQQRRESPLSAALVLVSTIIIGLAAVILAMPYHIQHIPFASLLTDREINPIGKMQPNKYFALSFLFAFGLVNSICSIRALRQSHGLQDYPQPPCIRTTSILLAISVCSIVIMLTMGWTRETARAYNGYLIYNQFSLGDERNTYAGPPRALKN